MGLILDSSVAIAAERRGDTVEQLIAQVIATTGDQHAALSAIGLTELIHGIYRATTLEIRQRRESPGGPGLSGRIGCPTFRGFRKVGTMDLMSCTRGHRRSIVSAWDSDFHASERPDTPWAAGQPGAAVPR